MCRDAEIMSEFLIYRSRISGSHSHLLSRLCVEFCGSHLLLPLLSRSVLLSIDGLSVNYEHSPAQQAHFMGTIQAGEARAKALVSA